MKTKRWQNATLFHEELIDRGSFCHVLTGFNQKNGKWKRDSNQEDKQIATCAARRSKIKRSDCISRLSTGR